MFREREIKFNSRAKTLVMCISWSVMTPSHACRYHKVKSSDVE